MSEIVGKLVQLGFSHVIPASLADALTVAKGRPTAADLSEDLPPETQQPSYEFLRL
jgi:hypothetical protein